MKRTLLSLLLVLTLTSYSRAQGVALAMNREARELPSAGPSLADMGTQDQDDLPLLTFYPNPVKDFLNIRFRERTHHIVKIYNVVGALIKQKEVLDENYIKMDLTDVPKGMYFISYEPGNGKVITKTFTKDQN